MSYTIEVAESKTQMREFLEFPYKFYRDDPYWVPNVKRFQREMFDREKHPFFRHASVTFFLARNSNNEVVGRIVATVNHAHNEVHRDKLGFFGFLDAIKEQEVFDLLLEAASNCLREKGMEQISGPFNYSVNEECGLLVDGFDSSPVIMMTYNPPYYERMLENAGFRKENDLYAYLVDSRNADFSRLERIAKAVAKRSGTLMRDIDMKRLDEEIPLIMSIYNECWKDNWGFVPMTALELAAMAEELKMILNPRMAPVAEVDGEAVAFAIALPDVNETFKSAGGSLLKLILKLKIPFFRKKPECVRVILLGVKEEYRGRGLESLLIWKVTSEAINLGFVTGELSWILENNIPMRALAEKALNADRYKTYRIYKKEL